VNKYIFRHKRILHHNISYHNVHGLPRWNQQFGELPEDERPEFINEYLDYKTLRQTGMLGVHYINMMTD
jgi:hypothetical protein